MPRDTQRSFAGGVIGELLYSSADLERYRASVASAKNMMGVVPRGVTRAPGTTFIANSKTNSGVKRLIPFSYADGDAYAIELGHNYARFLRDGGYVSSGGAPYELVTPWSSTDIEKLDYQQSGNALYIVTGAPDIWRLVRNDHDDWSITVTSHNEGPLLTPNGIEGRTIRVTSGQSKKGSTATLDLVGFALTQNDVGSIFRIDDLADISGSNYWAAGQKPILNGLVRYAENVYKVTSVPNVEETVFSGNPPLHTEGTFIDGTENPVTLAFEHGEYGLIEILTVGGDGTTATAKILKNLPLRILSQPFWTWWQGAWSEKNGGPTAVTEKGGRLYFGKGARLDATTVGGHGDVLDFSLGSSADAALGLEPSQRDPIIWLEDVGALLVGTTGGVSSISQPSRRAAITPDPLPPLTPENQEGCADTPPIKTEGVLVYVNESRQKLIEMSIDDTGEAFNDVDLTIMNPEALFPGAKEITFTRNPDRMFVVPLIDGGLTFLVYQRDQNVVGWWPQDRHNAKFLTACAVRNSSGYNDDVYFIVARTIGGQTKHYVEYMQPRWRGRGSENPEDAHYLDCALRYNGAPTQVLSGFDHLNGETVSVFADGAMQRNVVVADGYVTIDEPASNILVGYPIEADFTLLPAHFETREGFTESMVRVPRRIAVRYYETSLAEVSGPGDEWQPIAPTAGGVMSSFVPALSGVSVVGLDSEESLTGNVSFRAVGALPMTILAVETSVDMESR